MARLDQGQVDVSLKGETFTLKPTLNAMLKIDRQFGSIREAAARVQGLSLEALVFVIAAGADIKGKDAEALPEQVFKAGVINVVEPVSRYLVLLMNPSGQEEGRGEGKP